MEYPTEKYQSRRCYSGKRRQLPSIQMAIGESDQCHDGRQRRGTECQAEDSVYRTT